MSDPEDTATDFDDLDASFGPEFDEQIADDIDESRTGKYAQAAWQRLDERKDEQWLREQLSDWDDWDDDADLH